MRVVELKFFGGLSLEETGQLLGVSLGTVEREWQAARAWLYARLGPMNLLYTAIGVVVVAWIAQLIGHQIEGKRRSVLTDGVERAMQRFN